MTSKFLLSLAALLVTAACAREKVVDYAVQTNCAGGGGVYKCTAKNATANRLGPFDLEFDFIGDRGGAPVGRTTVTNSQGLEGQGEWEFDLVGPASARSVRLSRVVPK